MICYGSHCGDTLDTVCSECLGVISGSRGDTDGKQPVHECRSGMSGKGAEKKRHLQLRSQHQQPTRMSEFSGLGAMVKLVASSIQLAAASDVFAEGPRSPVRRLTLVQNHGLSTHVSDFSVVEASACRKHSDVGADWRRPSWKADTLIKEFTTAELGPVLVQYKYTV